MPAELVTPPKTHDEAVIALADALAQFAYDPLGFVLWAWAWGEPGELERESGPDDWQVGVLEDIGEKLMENPWQVIRECVASGHGIGKSALVAWIVIWAELCWPMARGTITANTDGQLRTKTWPEVTKWFNMLMPLLRDLFTATATALYSSQPERDRTWRMDAVPWSKSNTAAFAGLHNAGRIVLVVMDEASEIDDAIWEVIEGATTDADTTIIWLAFGNPTKNTGRFKEVMSNRYPTLWHSRRVDSRHVKRTNKETLKGWEDAYGEDSDFFRVRVKGMFPRSSSLQFIPEDLVVAARKREPGHIVTDAVIWGVDVARHGDDFSELVKRQGRDARSLGNKSWSIPDLMMLAEEVAREYRETPDIGKPDAIFVDATGMGWGVVDRLRQLNIPNVYAVNFGDPGGMAILPGNVQAACTYLVDRIWAEMREWLREGGAIPDDDAFQDQLIGRQYGYDRNSAIRLEKKSDMKSRGLASPDKPDALALTFTWPVAPRQRLAGGGMAHSQAMRNGVATGQHDPYSELG